MNRARRSHLLLTELVFDLLVFLLCAAVCTALFVRARAISRDSRALTNAVTAAQTAAETLRGSGPAEGTMPAEDGLHVSYRCTASDAVVTAEIAVSDGEQTLYTLTAAWPEVRP